MLDVQNAASTSSCQKALAVLSGVGTATWAPWLSYAVGRQVLHALEARNVRIGLEEGNEAGKKCCGQEKGSGCCGSKKENLGEVLKKWNQVWSQSGVQVRLEVLGIGEAEAEENGCGLERKHGACGRKSKCCERKGKCSDRKMACGSRKGNCHARKRRCCGRDERKRFRIVIETVGQEAGTNDSEKNMDEKTETGVVETE